MAKGRQRKKLNDQSRAIKHTLDQRLSEIQGYNLDKKEGLIKAIALLEQEVIWSDKKIAIGDFTSSAQYKNVLPKDYMKTIRHLKSKLTHLEKIKKVVSPKALHEISLFESSQKVNLQKDARTNQLNRLVTAIRRGKNQDGKIKFNSVDEIIKNIVPIWTLAKLPLPTEKEYESFYWPLFKDAIEEYSKLDIDFIYKTNDLQNKFTMLNKKLREDFRNENKVEHKPSIKSNPQGELERITDTFDALEAATKKNIKKRELTSAVIADHFKRTTLPKATPSPTPPHFFVGRLFVGSGYSGMTLMTTDPSIREPAVETFAQLENYLEHPEDKAIFLNTLLISDQDTGHWTRSQHRAEQEHSLLEIPGNVNAADFVPKSMALGNSSRINTRHLFYANVVNMAFKDTPPPLYGVKVQGLEKKDKHPDSWPTDATDFKYRVKVSIPAMGIEEAYIYAKTIDFTLGMGEGQIQAFEEAIAYEQSRHATKDNKTKVSSEEIINRYTTFDQKKGFTPIIHGNDYDLSDREKEPVSQKKTRRVVVIGGAGGAATAYRIAVLGTDFHGLRLQNSNKQFLKNAKGISLNPNVKIFSRGTVNYSVLAVQATESFEFAKSEGALYQGYQLIGIEVKPEGIALRFHNREGAKEIPVKIAEEILNKGQKDPEIIKINDKYFYVNSHEEICDQLIAGMGQDAGKIQSLIFKDLKPEDLQVIRGFDQHFVGLQTQDASIRFHGAMAGNLSSNFNPEITPSTEKSLLPRNARDQNIMPFVLAKFFSLFSTQEEKSPRKSFNVNTCFLKRADQKEEPTEFEIFLEKAGLTAKEIDSFITFLLNERQNNPSGAGVSFEDLTNFIVRSNFHDKLQVVSSSNIVSTQDMGAPDKLKNL